MTPDQTVPQSPAPKGRTALVVGLIVVVAVGALFIARVVQSKNRRAAADVAAKAESPPTLVQIAKVTRKDVPAEVIFTGSVRPKADVDVFAKVPGRVERVEAELGATVKAGQTLAVIEHKEIALQAKQVEAQLQAARAGAVQAQVNADAAKVQYERFVKLVAEKAVPQAEFEKVEAAHRAAQAGIETSKAQVALAEAAAALAAQNVENARVTSPVAGVIVAKRVELGAQASPAQPLFQVQDVTALKLEGTIAAADVSRVKVGDVAKIVVDELPGETFAASVTRMSPSLDARTRRASIEVKLEDAKGKLLPNMFAHASIAAGMRTGALVVPRAAVRTLVTGRAVYVVKEGAARSVTPTFGAETEDLVVVEDGLMEGDAVVVSGDAGLREGAAVTVQAEKR